MKEFTPIVAGLAIFATSFVEAQTTRLGSGNLQGGTARAGAAVAAAGGAAGATSSRTAGKVEIKRFPQPNKTSMVRTPEFTSNTQNTYRKLTTRPREWALFEIHYATEARWMDELAFTYHVMTKGQDEERKDIYSYYTLTLRYIDIPKGDHMSSVAIPPSLVERYGQPLAVALEIVGKDGTVLASESLSNIQFPTKEWWKDTNVMENPRTPVVRRPGLVDRSKTPFALINADDYEVIQ